MKRGTSGLCGVLAIDKPKGITSHDVVNAVRRVTNERRVGHAGTLDPMATGLMLVCVGAATRLSPYLTGHDKSYIARIVFGVATDTDDADGRIATAFSKSDPGEGLAALDGLDPQALLDSIVGPSLQLPPAYSAIKKNGVTAYKAAREGKGLELEPREVVIYKAALVGQGFEGVDLDDGQGGKFVATLPYWDVELAVSKGTYIRSIARDLGQRLGCGAHLSALRRITVADCRVEEAISLEQLVQFAVDGQEFPWNDPVALLGFPSVRTLSDDEMKDVGNGRSLKGCGASGLTSCVKDGRLMAIYNEIDGISKPEVVIPGGVTGVSKYASKAQLLSWNISAGSDIHLGERVLVVGVFDGLHDGHKTLFEAAKEDAKKRNIPVALVTFDMDPDEVFGRNPGTFKLMTNVRRVEALRAPEVCEAQEVVAIRATKENFALSPEQFLDKLGELCDVKSIHIGSDFRFGHKAAGTVDDLQAWCRQRGAMCCPQELFETDGEVVTASRIRGLLVEGDVDSAQKLGGQYKVWGTVARGRGEGAEMGFATANLIPEEGVLLPREGVYGGFALVDGVRFAAAINMGVAVSFENATAPIEAHLLDYEGDLYNKTIALEFVHWLRPQIKFESVEELIATVKDNIGWVRDNLVPIAAREREGR